MTATSKGAQGTAKRKDEDDAGILSAAIFTSPLIGRSPLMRHLLETIERVAQTDNSVLIMGATGTGKELIAHALHDQSPRRHAPFVDISCSAIPDTLVEAELFGHQRGTFTGAHETRRGLFEEASGGTLFLDELDALSPLAQSKLLRALQERQIRRVGGRENIRVDARIISATNRDMKRAVSEGAFRPDLYYRLSVIPLHVPDLRSRGSEDVRLLVEHMLCRAALRGRQPRRFSAAAVRALNAYAWPGNVRELENAVEYALSVSVKEEMGVEDLPPDISLHGDEGGGMRLLKGCLRDYAPLEEIECLYIISMLERCEGNQIKAAENLGIDRRTLQRKLKRYKLIKLGRNPSASAY